ncbi:MAG TPA: hypothetical protein VLL52_15375 [Anaerolineae bacterium]|nr:hypothetical protein [Anaerolineae bacterium]
MRNHSLRILLLSSCLLTFFWLTTNTASAAQPTPPPQAAPTCPAPAVTSLIAGDSWAQFMWDDDSHNDIFDKFGHADQQMLSQSLDSNPGPGYTGTAYAVSGSEARNWADTANYPYINNLLTAINNNPQVDTIVLSIGGNDFLAGKSGDGWYKDMDLDTPGSEAALFTRVTSDTWDIMNAIWAVHPDIDILISSYDYPNFSPSLCNWPGVACGMRRDLSRDPNNDLVTDAELNAMMVDVEQIRIDWANNHPQLAYDNAVGLMHYYYGDGTNPPGTLPKPGTTPPSYAPFPGGNPLLPNIRDVFRPFLGFDADPIHLNYDPYQYKITHQTEAFFFDKFRGQPTATFTATGGTHDGWTNGLTMGTDAIYIGDDSNNLYYGLTSFDTSALPDNAIITNASLYIMRQSLTGANPFTGSFLGNPTLDIATGPFGASPAVEISDASAPASAADVGCFYGTARANDYALRVDLTTDGLAAINHAGPTQFRFAFANTDIDTDIMTFFDGDASLPRQPQLVTREVTYQRQQPDGTTVERTTTVLAINHRGLAEHVGSPAPFLDITYCTPPNTPQPTALPNNTNLDISWPTITNAETYELWWLPNDPYTLPTTDCTTAPNCTLLTTPNFTHIDALANATINYTYHLQASNSCGGSATSPMTSFSTFSYPLTYQN